MIPADSEVKKAKKLLAAPAPTKWTPAKAAASRRAKMIIAVADGHPDAWLYVDILFPRLTMLPGELQRNRFAEVNAARREAYPAIAEDEARAAGERERHELAVIAKMAAKALDNDAEKAVLKIVRSGKLKGVPCMRQHGETPCRIVDNNSWDGPILFEGNSWAEVLRLMKEAGL